MKRIDKLEKNYKSNVNEIDQINSIGTDIGEILVEMLNNLKTDYNSMPSFIPFKEKLDVVIEQIKNLKSNPYLLDKYHVIHNQSIVLLVSNFEIFINSLVIMIGNNFPELFNWKEKEKIAFDPNILKHTKPSYGDLILEHLKNKYNYQDLKSILECMDMCLNIKKLLTKKEEKGIKENIILYQAARHIIVHNMSKVDNDFIKQIRNTDFYERYNTMVGDKLLLRFSEYEKAKESFLYFVNNIISGLKDKIREIYGDEFADMEQLKEK